MAGLEFRHIEKTFDDGTRLFRDLSLRVERGELLVLLGPSGCGKSTLLRMAAGLEAPSAGEIVIDERAVTALTPQQRNVAMVFQNYALYPHMSVRENLEFPLRMRRASRAERRRRVAETARTLGLDPVLDQHPRQLSGGQRQRVAMGRALVRDPAVFLMDEPLSNLDAKLRVEVRGEIAALQREARITTLYVTHDQVEAMTLGQRVAVLHDGELRQVDTPPTLYQRPADVFVAGFLGSPAMNLFRARVDRGPGELRLGAARLALPPLARPAGDRPAPIAGLRPEAFRWPDGMLPELDVRVTMTEDLGPERIVYFEAPETLIDPAHDARGGADAKAPAVMAARLWGGPRPVPGDDLRLAVDAGQVHWFDEDGVALGNGG